VDTFTITLDAPIQAPGLGVFRPGQFNMLYAFGVGEVPISTSGDPAEPGVIVHTIRSVGTVTRKLATLRAGDYLGLRGPFGSSWPVEEARGRDIVFVTGGIGLAPLRPAIYHVLRHRQEYGQVAILYGARTPADRLYAEELETWSRRGDIQVLTTVDRADRTWTGNVGLVTALFSAACFNPPQVCGLVCGPEVMMRFVQQEFARRGVREDQVYLSLERNMQCAIGFCGHCQFGPNFVCMDGPVFRYDRIQPFFQVRET
jgi:NAD(P)H-flavin reductase